MYDKVKIKTWVDALRSGDYKQGADQLCQVDVDGIVSYCCLGVYKKVVDNLTDEYLMSSSERGGPKLAYEHLTEMLGVAIMDSLMGKNDLIQDDETHGYTFKDIADYIEKKLL